MIQQIVEILLVTLDGQVPGIIKRMICLKKIGPHLGMASSLGVRRPLPTSGIYLPIRKGSKMQKARRRAQTM